MARCDVCKDVIFGNGYKSDGQVFCSAVCSAYSPTGRFCDECEFETTDEPAGRIFVYNFMFGTSLIGHRDRCPRCYSVVQRKCIHFFLPIPVARYRVLYLSGTALRNQFLSRRVNGPLGEMVRQGPRAARPRSGSPVPPPNRREWRALALFGLIFGGWGIYDYVTLARLEVTGGEWSSFGIVMSAYDLGGKWAVLGVFELLAALAFVAALRVYRGRPPLIS